MAGATTSGLTSPVSYSHRRHGGLPTRSFTGGMAIPLPCRDDPRQRPSTGSGVDPGAPGGIRTHTVSRYSGGRLCRLTTGANLVWKAGFEPAVSSFRGRRERPGFPTSRNWFRRPRTTAIDSLIDRPSAKEPFFSGDRRSLASTVSHGPLRPRYRPFVLSSFTRSNRWLDVIAEMVSPVGFEPTPSLTSEVSVFAV